MISRARFLGVAVAAPVGALLGFRSAVAAPPRAWARTVDDVRNVILVTNGTDRHIARDLDSVARYGWRQMEIHDASLTSSDAYGLANAVLADSAQIA